MVVDYVALGGILLMILIIFYLLFDPITTIHHHFHFLTGFEVCVSCFKSFSLFLYLSEAPGPAMTQQ